MSDQIFLAAIIGPVYLVTGLSLLMYSKTWKTIVSTWIKDHTSLIGPMFFSLVFGLAIINMHNVWEWSPFVVITITGWGAFLKGVLYFLLPGDSFKSMMEAVNCDNLYKFEGALIAALGAWLSYLVYLV